MDKYIYEKTTVFGTNCKANIIRRVLLYPPEEEKPIGIGIYGISRSISGCSMSIC